MRPIAFSNDGTFYKGNLHTHSTLSDGALAPAEVCRRYRERGYDFMALTDHFVGMCNYPVADTRAFRTEGFTTLIGAELHSGAMSNGELWHILAVGLPFDFAPTNTPAFHPVPDQETGPEIARRARAAGAFVTIVHPEWSGLNEDDMISIESAHAVEVYNHGSAVENDRGAGLHSADLLARSGRQMSFIATDDAHFNHGEQDAFGGWTMVKATENTPEALLAALKAGACYASMGPEFLDIEVTDETVNVRCSPVSAVVLLGAGVSTKAVFGTDLCEAKLSRESFASSPWLRVSLIDSKGLRAWSSPIWL